MEASHHNEHPSGMGKVEPLQSVIMLETLIMAPKEVTIRMKGHTMWPTILKTCPIIKVVNIAIYAMILIVSSPWPFAKLGIDLISPLPTARG